jgi:hypothetical protein
MNEVGHAPILIKRTTMVTVKNKFLGVHISDELKLLNHTDGVVKARRKLFNLRLNKLVRQLHLRWPQGSTEGGTLCRKYLPSRIPKAPDVAVRPRSSSRTSAT